MLYLGLTLGIVAGNHAANLARLDSARVFTAMLLLAIVGLVGARLLFVVTHSAAYRREPRRIWRRSEGGASVQGGLPLAVLVSVPLLRVLEVPFAAFWDAATFTCLIWLMLGRVGCLLHGCCVGRPSNGPLALSLPDWRGIRRERVPTQLLEAAWAALLLLGALAFWDRRPFPGALFLCAVAAYGLGRFALQPAREVQEWIGSFNLPRALSAGLVAVSLASLLVLWLGTTQTT